MDVFFSLNIPSNYYKSERTALNQEASPTEIIAKSIIEKYLEKDVLRRGNDKLQEPDWITNTYGYEVTVSDNKKIINKIEAKNSPNKTRYPISFQEDILNRIEKKKEKKYCCKTKLIILSTALCIEFLCDVDGEIDLGISINNGIPQHLDNNIFQKWKKERKIFLKR